MEKEFTLYPEALELKGLGYPQNGYFAWYAHGGLHYDSEYIEKDFTSACCSAPTYSQAFRWFREKFGLYPDIHRIGSGGKFGACIEDLITGNSLEMAMEDPSDYEEAELASLKKMIEIVKRTRRSQS
jgi:hypothetical protein